MPVNTRSMLTQPTGGQHGCFDFLALYAPQHDLRQCDGVCQADERV